MTKDEQWLLEEKYHGSKTATCEADMKRLATGEPLAYVIGHQPFMGLKIYLDSRPLIPRPETEWWTEKLVASMKQGISARLILDLCAGSGAIGCAVLKNIPGARVYFGEIDPAHKPTILKNIRENNLEESRAEVRIGDLFDPFVGLEFDVIAANPPYIPENRDIDRSVVDHEPARALFAGTDGLRVIRAIAKELPSRLQKGGAAWIECDHAHTEAARALFVEQGFAAEIRTDQYDAPRVIVVSFP